VLHDLPRTHVAIALLILLMMLGGAAVLLVRARRRPKPRGIRVDLVGGTDGGDADDNRP
jgi:hypothetical protein